MGYKIKNWKLFQHFKDRCPPWIKVHRKILDQLDINVLSDRSFRVLIGLWLLASEDKQMIGLIPDVDQIAFRLRMPKDVIDKALEELSGFLIPHDIKMLSGRCQDDDPETETEADKKRDNQKDPPPPTPPQAESESQNGEGG